MLDEAIAFPLPFFRLKVLTFGQNSAIIDKRIGVWLSLVERLVRDQEVVGSNPVTPTTGSAGPPVGVVTAVFLFVPPKQGLWRRLASQAP